MTQDGTGARSRHGPDLTYAWPRFWSRDGTMDLSDSGFLRDPTEDLARSPRPAQLAALQDWKALVLLGEPGIGKSTTLKDEADRVAAFPADADTISIYADLRNFFSDAVITRRFFWPTPIK